MSLTLLTGVPGSSKTLYTVAVLLQDLLKSTYEKDGESHPRKIYTNIKNLLLEHEPINAENLNNWHEWCKAGDVICFDEVQEVWRPRAMGIKPSPAIEKLEVHRHMGVDLILITQHPMLLDQNVRRLVGRHIHFRPFSLLFWKFAVGYEWDHASNPAMVKGAMATFQFWHKKKYYSLYKSAEVHTKQKRKMPAAIWVLAFALTAFVVGTPLFLGRMKERYFGKPATEISTSTVKGDPLGLAKNNDASNLRNTSSGHDNVQAAPVIIYPITDLAKIPKEFRPAGCIVKKNDCQCYDDDGGKIEVELKQCLMATTEIRLIKAGKAQNGYSAPSIQNEVKNEPIPSAKIDNGIELNFPQKTVEQKYDKQAIGQNFLPVPAHVNSGGVVARGS